MGAVLVLVGSLALGIRIAYNMRSRLNSLRELERIIGFIEGELRYKNSVLEEALLNVSEKCGQPFKAWLMALSDNCQINQSVVIGSIDNLGSHVDFYTLWSDSLCILSESTQLISKDIAILRDVGRALGYLDVESQLMNMNMERELIHQHIICLDKDLNNRMKNAIILCFLGGVMTVITLV